MIRAAALLDSNVLIAALAGGHEHHVPSAALLNDHARGSFAVAAHSFAEAYAVLTRKGGPAPFGFTPAEAAAALGSVRAAVQLIGLTPGQTLQTIEAFAAAGGVGARLDDALIGQCAALYALPCIVTWNTPHMASLCGGLNVVTPAAFAARGARV